MEPIQQLIDKLSDKYRARICARFDEPAKLGVFADIPTELHSSLRQALIGRGIKQLYSHQHQAWQSARSKQHTCIVTPTASGKTLCYNLPVLDSALRHKSKALYLFPTKALSQDQVAELIELNEAGNLGIRAFTFDGDTPGDARKAVRTRGDIVVTNPDMLHQGVLPHHTKWAQFFESLQYVVIDEMHIYRGVFGAHMANVIRRLRRVCQFYGSNPQFICSSATIANPKELAEQLIEEPVNLIDESGAPCGARHTLIWNPPVVNPELGIRASARSQTSRIARIAVKLGLKSIIFANSRLMVEVLTKYLKDVFDNDPRKTNRVAAYRGGYLPQQRRSIEQKMRAGDLDCIVTTSALELGVDIGSLDVCVLNGYPGTIASARQRMGRAGRRQRQALCILVANSNAIDQFITQHPKYFFENSPETARIDANQMLILLDHIRCAAFELPFTEQEQFGQEQGIQEFLEYLAEQGIIQLEKGRWHWIGDGYPANTVNLRSVANGNFLVIDKTDGKKEIIAEVDYSAAALTLYEGAIYMVQACPWQVEKLDWEGRKAYVKTTKADYYTDAIDYTKLKILSEFETRALTSGAVTRGEVHVLRRVAGYKKIRYYTHENIGFGDVNLPDQELHTTAVWWSVPQAILEGAFSARWQALDGLLGVAYALHQMACLHAMCETRDLGRSVGDKGGEWTATSQLTGQATTVDLSGTPIATEDVPVFTPGIFLYDNYPGGMGISTVVYDKSAEIIADTRLLIERCSCQAGCPACIGPVLVDPDNPLRHIKSSALTVLKLLADALPSVVNDSSQ